MRLGRNTAMYKCKSKTIKMKKINQIIANGILSMDNVNELLAQAIEANNRLASFLCGDCPMPTNAESAAEEYCLKNSYKLVSIGTPELNSDFSWEVRVNYTKTRYAKTPDETNSYRTRTESDEEYKFQVEIEDYSYINL